MNTNLIGTLFFATACASPAVFAASVTNVVAWQNWPWDSKVKIEYLLGDASSSSQWIST